MSEELTCLLLVGRSGHGKSSTGNSILGEKVFQPKFAVTEDSQSEGVTEVTREVSGRKIQVVDATGLSDNDQEFPENADHFIELANEAIQLAHETGYSAIVLVLKYGIRFTKQEVVAVQMIKSLFGPEVIKHHGIIVMTCGDQFERDMEDEGLSFPQWCEQQEGEVKRLMEECGQPCVLFDNKTEDPERQSQQIEELMDMVDQVKGQAGTYKKINFQDAEPGWTQLRVMGKLPELEKDLTSFLQDLNKQDPGTQQDCDYKLQKLDGFEARLREEDEETGCLDNLIMKLDYSKQRLKMQQQSLKQKEAMQTSSHTAAVKRIADSPKGKLEWLLDWAQTWLRGLGGLLAAIYHRLYRHF